MGNLQTKPQDIQITLISRRSVAGFKHKKELVVYAMPGETFGDVLARFNTFRSPENQIANFLTAGGAEIQPNDLVTACAVYIN